MNFISPGVYTREVDLTTTVSAVSTNISVIVIREPWKGAEHTRHFVNSQNDLINKFGTPTNKSNIDILSALEFLKYGNQLYVSCVRPADATFAGIKISDGYSDNGQEFNENYTYSVTGTVDASEEDGPYDYLSLGTVDLTMMSEYLHSSMLETDDVLWILSNWRGNSSNKIRTLIFDRNLFSAIRYYNEDDGSFDAPDTVSITESASANAVDMYENNEDAYYTIKGTNIILDSSYQAGIIIQAQDQGSANWVTKELFVVSTDMNERDDSGESLFVETVINEKSSFIKVALNPKYTTDAEIDAGIVEFGTKNFVELTGGKNGKWGRADGLDYEVSIDSAVIEAYDLYSNPEEIDVNLFLDSDKGEEVKRRLIEICQVLRKDSFAILDVPRNLVLNNRGNEARDLVRWRKGQGGSTFNPNSSYAAIYGNWVEVFDKWNKKYVWIPSTGPVAGVFANTDQVSDPWFAAAGLNRGILTGVRRLAWNPILGDRELIYKDGINPIVSFAGIGKAIYGQKTLLDKSSAFNRINIRRLFLVLQKAISKTSAYYLFEQNDEVTWMLMTNMITPFLRDIKGRRGIYDFLVQIDSEVNTPERIDRNELWGNIFISPTRTAEQIRLSFIATPTGANFMELTGAV